MTDEGKRGQEAEADFVCDRPIVLVGMMGAGKTTVGRRLAARLRLPFYDADEEIQKAAGMSISELFAAHGEESFRRGEAQVIARLLEGPPHVLATGGGAVLTPETRRLIKERAVSVWIRADLDLLIARATRRDTRPLLRTENPKETMRALLKAREPLYAEADIVVESEPRPHTHMVETIIERIGLLMKERGDAEKTI